MVKRQRPGTEYAPPQPAATIEDIRGKLESLPEKQKSLAELTKLEIIAELRPTISSARAKGYSWSEIHQLLGEMGIKISEVTLKAYVTENRKSRSTSKSKSSEHASHETRHQASTKSARTTTKRT